MTLPYLLFKTASIYIDLTFSLATLLYFHSTVLLSMFPLLLSLLYLFPVCSGSYVKVYTPHVEYKLA
jgi:hypothetical protein